MEEEEDVLEVLQGTLEEDLPERIGEQHVVVPAPHVEPAVSSGGAGSCWSRISDTTSIAAAAADTAVLLLGLHSITQSSVPEKQARSLSAMLGLLRLLNAVPRRSPTSCLPGEWKKSSFCQRTRLRIRARHQRKDQACTGDNVGLNIVWTRTTCLDLEMLWCTTLSFEKGLSWPRPRSMNSAGATAVVKSAGEARPPGFAKYRVTSESDDEESSSDEDEAGSSQVARPAQPQQQQSQSLLVKFGLLDLQIPLTASRRT